MKKINKRYFNEHLKSLYIKDYCHRRRIIQLCTTYGVRSHELKEFLKLLGYPAEITYDNILEYVLYPQKRNAKDKIIIRRLEKKEKINENKIQI